MLISLNSILSEKFLLIEKANYEKYYADKMDQKTFDYLISIDPSKKKKFETWILNNYLKLNPKEQIRLIKEDGYKVTNALNLYDKGQAFGIIKNPYNDIKNFESFKDLYDYIRSNKLQFDQLLNSEESNSDNEEGLKIGKDYILMYEDEHWKVVDTLTWKANCYFGSNTSWCTTDPNSSSTFDGYIDYSPLVIIIDKKNKHKYQIHEDSQQYMDERDFPFNIFEVARSMPKKLLNILYKKGFESFNPENVLIFNKLYKLDLKTLRELLKESDVDGGILFYFINSSSDKKLSAHLNDYLLQYAFTDYAIEKFSFESSLDWWEDNPSLYIDDEPNINPEDPDDIDSYDKDQIIKIENNYYERESEENDYYIESNLRELNYINTRDYSVSTYEEVLNKYIYNLNESFDSVTDEEIKNIILWLIEDVGIYYAMNYMENIDYYISNLIQDYEKVISNKNIEPNQAVTS